jgi:hypothetical protein
MKGKNTITIENDKDVIHALQEGIDSILKRVDLLITRLEVVSAIQAKSTEQKEKVVTE